MLENGDLGVLFNDQTSLIHLKGRDFLVYIKRKKELS